MIIKKLKNFKLAKKTQAMISQAVVESTVTINCETRAWQKQERKDMQKILDLGLSFCMDE